MEIKIGRDDCTNCIFNYDLLDCRLYDREFSTEQQGKATPPDWCTAEIGIITDIDVDTIK